MTFEELFLLVFNEIIDVIMKWTKVLNLAAETSISSSSDVSHVMRKMIIDDSAFLFNQREKSFAVSASTGYFAL